MAFVKGKSGNPGGMSKNLAKMLRLARKHSPKAIEKAALLMDSAEKDSDKLKACELIIKVSGGMRIGEAQLGITPEQQQGANVERMREELLGHLKAAQAEREPAEDAH